MSKIASLEVYREAHALSGANFLEKTGTFSSRLLEEVGASSVTLRPNDVVEPTIIHASEVYKNLRYVHFRAAGLNTDKLYKKFETARDKIIPSFAPRCEEIMSKYGVTEYDLLWELVLDEVGVVSAPTKDGNKNFVVLRSSKEQMESEVNPLMLTEMSIAASGLYVSSIAKRHHTHELETYKDCVPVAKLSSPDYEKIDIFVEHVKELLPLRIQVESDIAFSTNSNV